MAITYQAASWDTKVGRCQPGAMTLSAFIRYFEPSFTNLGCFNDRAVRGSGSPSLHREGRAIDIGANANVPAIKARMDTWVSALIEHHEKLGVQQIIWNKRSWRTGGKWKAYNGAVPHTDHAHIELTWDGAGLLTNEKITNIIFPNGATGDDMLQLGSRGALVTELQRILNFWAQHAPLPAAGTADGIFGEGTAKASRAFKALMRESSTNPGALGDTPNWAPQTTWVEYGAWLQRIASLNG